MDYAKYIDHSLLHPTNTDTELESFCKEAINYNVAAVCVKPDAVIQAKQLLQNTTIAIATVISFPHGNATTESKQFETLNAIKNGATEIDVVVNIGKVKAHNWEYVKKELQILQNTCSENNVILKVIFETAFLRDDEILRLCSICSKIGIAFVKTCTGFDYEKQTDGTFKTIGADIRICKLMKANISSNIKLKASGGIRNSEDFLAFIEAGASRIGTSSTKVILDALKKQN